MIHSHIFTKRAVALMATVLILGLAACNTISGAGQDIKNTGKAIEKTAEDSK